ncbi:MAG TPA: class I SAM-dependent methyltransferase [Candidatus Paceibacterota bacterium]|nr:class I SAM-dependent methyltransferase [Candidatus Paceibacterota bacterium]
MESPQIDKKGYEFARYGFEERFTSYYWQLREVLGLKPTSILEIGVGDGVFGNFVKTNTDIAYTSLDIAPDLGPDIVGSVTHIPKPDKSVDVACAFEVLEHIPFEKFDQAVGELARVARTHVVLSLPHFGPPVSFSLKIPFLPHVRISLKVPFPKEHVFNGQHYWEIGKKGYSPSRIRKVLEKHGRLERDFVPFGSTYHHFFVVRLLQ